MNSRVRKRGLLGVVALLVVVAVLLIVFWRKGEKDTATSKDNVQITEAVEQAENDEYIEKDEHIEYEDRAEQEEITDHENPANRNEEAMQAYEEFLHGERATKDGRYLTDLLPEYNGFLWNGYVDAIEYGYLDAGADDMQELLVKFVGMDIYSPGDDSTKEYVLYYDGKDVVTCLDYETWARSYTGVSYYGVVDGGGSTGAASHYYEKVVLDAQRNTVPICQINEEYELNSYCEPFYSAEIDLLAEGEILPNMGLYTYKIGDVYYLVYDAVLNEERASYEEFAEFCSAYGYPIRKLEEMDEIIRDYAVSQGIEAWLIEDETPIVFQTLEKQWYEDYIEPENLQLSESEQELLTDVAYALYLCMGEDAGGDHWSYEIQECLKQNMSMFLFWAYHDKGEHVESRMDDYGYTDFYRIPEEEADMLLGNLFAIEYDFELLGAAQAGMGLGACYENGALMIYQGAIGLGTMGPVQRGLQESDASLEYVVDIDSEGECVGQITLWINVRRNDYGYEITGCNIQ